MSAAESLPAPTISLNEAVDCVWDGLVVGAGPAGAFAARELAREGLRVLLVDKARFPRSKVCGCCLNGAALATLADRGLALLPARLGARRLESFHVATAGHHATVPLPAGVALSRERFDAALIGEAIRAGCEFLPQTQAALGQDTQASRNVTLRCHSQSATTAARVVLAADGLAGGLLKHERGCETRIARRPRIGVATILDQAPPAYHAGTIFMACARRGYVGLVRLEDGRLDLAAALEPFFVRRVGGPWSAVDAVLREAGLSPIEGLDRQVWRGTPTLTRHRALPAAPRVFALGDAAGYVEPFTGEGIAWALSSAVAVKPFVVQAVDRWHAALPRAWARRLGTLAGRRRRLCRMLTLLLRVGPVTGLAIRALGRAPGLAGPWVRWLNRPWQDSGSMSPCVDRAG